MSYSNTYAIGANQALYAWGDASVGQMGDNSYIAKYNPMFIASSVAAVTSGFVHVHFLYTTGVVKGFGYNAYGMIGDGTTTTRPAPVSLPGLPGPIVDISDGGYHSGALTTGGVVYLWGQNTQGQVCTGNFSSAVLYPVPMVWGPGFPSVPKIADIQMSSSGGAALSTAHVLYMWGDNTMGQVGVGTLVNSASPQIPLWGGLFPSWGIAQTSGGAFHMLALGGDHNVYAWGMNNAGQLGDGTRTNRLTPVAVVWSGVSIPTGGIVQVSAGGSFSCALGADSAVYSWGINTWGNLGDLTRTDRLNPVLANIMGYTVGKLWSEGQAPNHTSVMIGVVAPSPTPSVSLTSSETPTSSVTSSVTSSTSVTPSDTATASTTGSVTPTISLSATPSVTPSTSASMSVTPSTSATPSVTGSASTSITASQSSTSSITPTRTASPSGTPTSSASPSVTPSVTPSTSSSATTSASISSTPSSSLTPSKSPTPTSSVTPSVSPTPTQTPSITPSMTSSTTSSVSATRSVTPTTTATHSSSKTTSLSASPSTSVSGSLTRSVSPTATVSISPGCPRDACGVCHGNNDTCAGCDGIPWGAVPDACGECGGDNSTCLGCNGIPIPLGGYYPDACGNCVANSNVTECIIGCDNSTTSGMRWDCQRVCGGSAVVDECGVCTGGTTNITFNYHKDLCGRCFGQNANCTTCPIAQVDTCGICNGRNETCVGCDGVLVPRGGKTIDRCGVCGGDGTSCELGCDHVAGSGLRFDCLGVCNGTSFLDVCGACVPAGRNPNRTRDTCGVCFGGNRYRDTCGVCFAAASSRDDCGVCFGANTHKDECGVCWGNNGARDVCNVCFGNGTSCLGCDGIPFSGLTEACGVCGAACSVEATAQEVRVTLYASVGAAAVFVTLLPIIIVCLVRRRRRRALAAHTAEQEKEETARAPDGEVTFVFANIDRGMELWETHHKTMMNITRVYAEEVTKALLPTAGYAVKVENEGCMFMLAFHDAATALKACLLVREGMSVACKKLAADLPDGVVRINMGIHRGPVKRVFEPRIKKCDYYGIPVNRAARVMQFAKNGQLLASGDVTCHLTMAMRKDVTIRSLGPQQFKGVTEEMVIFQINPVTEPSPIPLSNMTGDVFASVASEMAPLEELPEPGLGSSPADAISTTVKSALEDAVELHTRLAKSKSQWAATTQDFFAEDPVWKPATTENIKTPRASAGPKWLRHRSNTVGPAPGGLLSLLREETTSPVGVSPTPRLPTSMSMDGEPDPAKRPRRHRRSTDGVRIQITPIEPLGRGRRRRSDTSASVPSFHAEPAPSYIMAHNLSTIVQSSAPDLIEEMWDLSAELREEARVKLNVPVHPAPTTDLQRAVDARKARLIGGSFQPLQIHRTSSFTSKTPAG